MLKTFEDGEKLGKCSLVTLSFDRVVTVAKETAKGKQNANNLLHQCTAKIN